MEGYTQITLDEWVQMKESLKRDLVGVQESFVRIGYTLRKIEEQKLYGQDGYKNITEFAKAEYGLNPSTVSRFMAINRKFSIDGYSDRLRPEFAQLGSSKLSEMLALPDQDMEMIKPEATRESIRDLKQFNREEPKTGIADDIRGVIRQFFTEKREILEELCSSAAYAAGEVKKMVEIVNPNGTRTYRKGLYFLMMYEQEIDVKEFRSKEIRSMSWEEFFMITKEVAEGILRDAPESEDKPEGEALKDDTEKIEEGKAGEAVPMAAAAGNKPEDKGGMKESADPERKEDIGKIAPAQKEGDGLDERPEDKPENREKPVETTYISEQSASDGCEGDAEAEESKELSKEAEPGVYWNRKEYMNTLTPYQMAHYLVSERERMSLKAGMLDHPSQLIGWLTQDVDEQGREIVDV